MNFRYAHFFVVCLVCMLLLPGCAGLQPTPAYTPWAYADLRGLDAADFPQPGLDLLAAYTRNDGARLEIRLDFLEQGTLPEYDLYLALDALPSGRYDLPGGPQDLPLNAQADIAWDTLLVIPASGDLQALDEGLAPSQNLALRVMRDPTQDTVVVSLDSQALYGVQIPWAERVTSFPILPKLGRPPAGFPGVLMQAFITAAGSQEIADSLGPIHITGMPPPPARAMFVFWNSFPAYTPATALRRWNGAHTGPFGGSHGLALLLRAAHSAGVPLVLLDLRTPAALSALDYASGLGLVQEMEREGLLALPEYIPDLPASEVGAGESLPDQVIAAQRQVALDFGLRPTRLASAPGGLYPSANLAQLIFARMEGDEGATQGLTPVTLQRRGNQRVVPVIMGDSQSPQTTTDGLSLEVKRALVTAALAASQSAYAPLVILGGDLPASAWGAAAEARAGFRYLHTHPWIQVMSAEESAGEQAQAGTEGGISGTQAWRPYTPYRARFAVEETTDLLTALMVRPQNSLGQAAWQAYMALCAPVYPADQALADLRARYAGQVWSLLAGAGWARQPTPMADCTVDPDHDSQPECVLSSERFYAQFEIESGGLTFLFEVGDEPHQLVGPTSQLITGLSDAADWDLSAGLSADPSVIPGAFAEPGLGYQAFVDGDSLVFISADQQVRKVFRLLPDGLLTEYHFASHPPFTNIQVPLALDPWQRLIPGWADRYYLVSIGNQNAWQVESGPRVEIEANSGYIILSSLDSRLFFNHAEDPNMDYPPGNFLPFPLALVESRLTGDMQDIRILIRSIASGGP